MSHHRGLLRRAAAATGTAALTCGTLLAAPVLADEHNAASSDQDSQPSAVHAPAIPGGEGDPGPNTMIVGGHVADKAPSFIAGLYAGDSFNCTASLVAPHWVLTAEHCVGGSDLSVRVGSLNRTSGGVTANVTEAVKEPSGSDIALLRIDKDIEAEYPDLGEPGDATTGTSERVYGWGYTNSNWTDLSETLKYSTGTITDANCNVLGATLCIHNDGDTAGGDSGGPMMTTDGGTRELVGTCTAGHKPTDGSGFGAYSDITKYRDWIDRTIAR